LPQSKPEITRLSLNNFEKAVNEERFRPARVIIKGANNLSTAQALRRVEE
jgi:hypothetical protein